jgi:hypothetical protein
VDSHFSHSDTSILSLLCRVPVTYLFTGYISAFLTWFHSFLSSVVVTYFVFLYSLVCQLLALSCLSFSLPALLFLLFSLLSLCLSALLFLLFSPLSLSLSLFCSNCFLLYGSVCLLLCSLKCHFCCSYCILFVILSVWLLLLILLHTSHAALMPFFSHLSVRCGILPCLSFSHLFCSSVSIFLSALLFFFFPLFFLQLYFFLYFPLNYILSGTYFSLSLPSRKSVWMSLEINKSSRLQK